jgi:hypothetical protein
MPEDPGRLKLWRALEKGTDQQRAMVRQLVQYAAPLLDRVIETFPTYTLHNAEHARNVAENMASLLGERINDLLPAEAALLILAAYFHDIGMVFSEDERSNLAAEPEWNEFLERKPEAFVELKNVPEGSPPPAIAEWYCRWRHADRVYVHLQRLERDRLTWGVVNLFETLGELCRSHDKNVSALQANPELTTDGIDGADLRFCAILLRLADILDFDGSRSPEPVYRHLGLGRRDTPRTERSDVEWRKHLSSGGIQFPPTRSKRYELRFTAGPDHPAVEHDVRQFLSAIEQELEHCAGLLPSCSDRWRDLDLPASVDRNNIKSNGYRYGEYRFTLDQDHVLQLLMGERLYGSPYVFVREILQNAIDATRLRTHLERAHGNPKFAPRPIRVSEWTDADQYRWVRFDDDGTGMDEHIIRAHLLRVGSSYYGSAQFKADMLRAGEAGDFMPISRFGIGLLSCFIACDRIEISTLRRPPPGEKINPIRLSLDGLQGFFVLRTPPLAPMPMPGDSRDAMADQKYRTTPGTSIACRLDPTKEQGTLRLREILDQYLLAPPVPVDFEGEHVGGAVSLSEASLIEPAAFTIGDQAAAELTEKIGLPFESDAVSISIKPISFDQYSPVPELRGGMVWARLDVKEKMAGVLGESYEYPIDVSVRTGYASDQFGTASFEQPLAFHVRVTPSMFRIRSKAAPLASLDDEQKNWLEMVGDLHDSELSNWYTAINLPRHATPADSTGRLFPQRRRSLVLSHNGIAVPTAPPRSYDEDLTLPTGSAWCALFLSDRLRPDLSISRDELRGLPWEVHSAFALTLLRALSDEGLEREALLALHPLRKLTSDSYLSIARLASDPLLEHKEHWQSERLFLVVDEAGQVMVTLEELMQRVAAGVETTLVLHTNHISIGSGSAPPPICAAAALACKWLDLAFASDDDWRFPYRLRVRGPRVRPMVPGEQMFAPMAFLPFEGSTLLRGQEPCLNSNHVFAGWMIEHASELARRFPGITQAIQSVLLNVDRYQFNADKAVDALTGLLERLGQLAPDLRPAKSWFPTRADFLPDA